MKKLLAVFGTRPEAIKMCPLISKLKERENIDISVCVTGQHREMLYSVLDEFDFVPEYDLKIMREGQSLSELSSEMLARFDKVIKRVNPDFVIVHGDTSTSFCAALAAFYRRIPVMHIEAGLRTGDIFSPYPEEFNRRAVSMVSSYHFAPTESARENLLREGADPDRIFVTGNTVIDALRGDIREDYTSEILDLCKGKRIVLLTAHRRESLGEPIRNIFRAVKRLAEHFEDIAVLYPLHKNPEVRSAARELLGGIERVILTEPLGVFDFHNILAHSCIVMTDSGGVQEEAAALSKPVLVLRDATERIEGIECGAFCLAGRDEESVFEKASHILSDADKYASMTCGGTIFGDGSASRRIADVISAIACEKKVL